MGEDGGDRCKWWLEVSESPLFNIVLQTGFIYNNGVVVAGCIRK